MVMSLRLLSLVSRLGALAAMPTVSARSCRFASRDTEAWMGQSYVRRASDRIPRQSHEVSGEEFDMEDEEDKLQALIDEERKRQRTVKYHIMRRQMTLSGPPERRLSWDAVNQIRYLKQEQPEEWTVERLAEGFSVTPDVILRVLRSKFIPTPERKAKQDAKVMARLSQQALSAGSGTRLPGHSTPAILPAGSTAGALVTTVNQTLMPRGKGSRSLAANAGSSAPLATQPTQLSVSPAVSSKYASVTTGSTGDDSATKADAFEEESEEEESWDGQVFSENELEELMLTTKPSPVVQVGKEFLDTENNFLYRI